MEIKVLWIDDQEFELLETLAESKGIDVTHVHSWVEAEPYLKDWHYDQWSAIILDCYCCMEKGGPEDYKFLRKAFAELYKISGESRIIPWYVLSGGSGERFDGIIDNQLDEGRELWDKDWKNIYYSKNEPSHINALMANILSMAPNLENYKVRYRFKDFFSALHTNIGGIDVFSEELEGLVFPVLKQILYPKSSEQFNPSLLYNQLRKAIEWFFRSCNTFGLLPDKFINEKTGVNLSDSLYYLGGRDAQNVGLRFGEKDKDYVLPPNMFYALINTLNVTNQNSHTKEYDDEVQKFFEEAGSEYVLFGMALGFVSIIIYYVKYLSNGHSDKSANLAKCVSTSDTPQQTPTYREDKEHYEIGTFEVKIDNDGNVHCEGCLLPSTLSWLKGKSVILEGINKNEQAKTKRTYPWFAKCKPVND